MARLTLEKLTRFGTLDEFFGKGPPGGDQGGPAMAPEPHLYETGRQYVTNFGGNSWLNLWSPVGDFSISQQWYGAGWETERQTVEGGWQIYEKKYKTKKAVLFIYWTADNYGTLKCYNLDCVAFRQINKNWFLGGIWDHYSTIDGTQ